MMQNDFGMVSIIMAAYNAEKTIEQAINSVLNQTYTDFELLVVNDCSKDRTVELVKRIAATDGRVRLVSNATNSGVSYTRKHGLKESNGSWIAILDSDDAWAPDKLEKQIELQKRTNADLLFTGSAFMDSDGQPIDWYLHAPAEVTYRQLLKQNVLSNSFSTYNSHSELCEAMTISKGYRRPKFGYFLRAESFYNVATKEIDYSDDDHPSKGYHQKSHGESFLAIAQDYMGADGVYIFDEPEAALSPQRQLTLLINIYRCAQEGAQFIIVSHSPILLGMPDAEIFSFDNGTIHPCQYEDTDSYVITKTFVNNRQHFLNQLLNEEP